MPSIMHKNKIKVSVKRGIEGAKERSEISLTPTFCTTRNQVNQDT